LLWKNTRPLKLLVIEEVKGSTRALLHYLRREGYRCDVALVTGDLSNKVQPGGYDCVLVNCSTSDWDGIRTVQALRSLDYNDGIIVLSTRLTSESTIASLHAGADDFLPYPVHPGELNARIITLIRRKHFSGNQLIVRNELSIDLPGKAAFVHQKPLDLTRHEFDLLLFLASHPNKVLSKEAIATNLAEEKEPHGNSDFIYAHIKNLKKKLAAAGSRDFIQSVYGMGYKFVI
jgi:DNA-binding response OmpR family regulator